MANEFKVYAAERYMVHVRTIKNTCRQLQDEVESLRADLTGVRGVALSDMPGSPNAYGDAIPDGLARIEEKIREYCTELAEWIDVEHEAHDAIKQIEDGRFRQLLWGHYISQKPWGVIAKEMHYSREYVRKELRNHALESLYDSMPEQWRRDFPKAV